MKRYFRFLLFPFALGVINHLLSASRAEGMIPASHIILADTFQQASLDLSDLPEILIRFLPLLLFQILYGTMIYRHFCTASVYFFSRKTNRIQWFLPECGKLFLHAVLYSAVLVLSGLGTVAVFGKLKWDEGALPLLAYFLIIYSLFLFFTTLAVNVLSILMTGSGAFIVVEVICLVNIAVYAVLDPLSRKLAKYEPPAYFVPGQEVPNFLQDWMWAIRPDFIANLNLSLHSKGIGVPEGLINIQKLSFSLNWSVLYFLALSLIVIVSGCLVVQKHSFIQANQETGGIL